MPVRKRSRRWPGSHGDDLDHVPRAPNGRPGSPGRCPSSCR